MITSIASRQLKSVIDRAVKEEEGNEDSRLTGGNGAGRFFLRSVELLVRNLDSMFTNNQFEKKIFSRIGKLFGLKIRGKRRLADFILICCLASFILQYNIITIFFLLF